MKGYESIGARSTALEPRMMNEAFLYGSKGGKA